MEMNELQGYLVSLMVRAVLLDHQVERGNMDVKEYTDQLHLMADSSAQYIASSFLDSDAE